MKKQFNKNQSSSILFIFQLPPPVHGASMVNKMIYESEKLKEIFNCDFVNLTTAKDVSDIGKTGLIKFWRTLLIYLKVISKVFKIKYALVYMTLSPHGLAFYKDGILAIFLKLIGCNLVFHLHGKGIKRITDKSKFKKALYKVIFKNVKVIHLSKLLYFDIKELVNVENVKFVPNGIKVLKNLNIKNSRDKSILYLSNMQESKGSFSLLEAAKILKDRKIDFKIDFVGKWHNDESFKKKWLNYYQQNELVNNVTYHGAKYDTEKERMFQNACCFILPTTNDCFPISILEAMSHKLPIISTNEGAITELVENNINGLIVDKNNPLDLANKLESLLKDEKQRDQMGVESFLKFQDNYTVSKFEDNMSKALKEIIENKI